MKTIIGMFMLLFSVSAYAESYGACGDSRECYCGNVGTFYRMASDLKNQGASPEVALSYLETFNRIIPIKVRKYAINQVFFDDGFFYAGGRALEMQMIGICMGNAKTFKPLK